MLSFPRRSQPAKYGEDRFGPPSLERSGSEHRRAVTSFPLMVKGKAWLGIKDPPAGEGQVGQKNTSLSKEGRGGSKNLTGWIEDYMTTQESLRRDVGKITSPCRSGYVGT